MTTLTKDQLLDPADNPDLIFQSSEDRLAIFRDRTVLAQFWGEELRSAIRSPATGLWTVSDSGNLYQMTAEAYEAALASVSF